MELQYPIGTEVVHDVSEVPMSRTHQYRKVMKPLLERKRRARINKCLDELKDLMVYALQSEGESITKLEKADVLELTVRHLRKLKQQRMLKVQSESSENSNYHQGFTACANEVSRCLASTPGVDVTLGTHVMSHLGSKLKTMEGSSSLQENRLSPLTVNLPTPSNESKLVPSSAFSDGGYSSGRESVSPRSVSLDQPINFVKKEVEERRKSVDPVWRPF